MNLGHELRALDAMNNLRRELTLMTSSSDKKVIDATNKLGLWMA